MPDSNFADLALNHFECYKVKLAEGEVFEPQPVALVDQFTDKDGVFVEKPLALCLPRT